MDEAAKAALRAQIESLPQLFSARHWCDYHTIAIELNQMRPPAEAVTPLQVHEAMAG